MIQVTDDFSLIIDEELKLKTLNVLFEYKPIHIVSTFKLDCGYYNCPSCDNKCTAWYYLGGTWRWFCKACFGVEAFLIVQTTLGFNQISNSILSLKDNKIELRKIYLDLYSHKNFNPNYSEINWYFLEKKCHIRSFEFSKEFDINILNVNHCLSDYKIAKKLINRIKLLQ